MSASNFPCGESHLRVLENLHTLSECSSPKLSPLSCREDILRYVVAVAGVISGVVVSSIADEKGWMR